MTLKVTQLVIVMILTVPNPVSEKKRAKRVVPYYYPKLSYSFLNRGPGKITYTLMYYT